MVDRDLLKAKARRSGTTSDLIPTLPQAKSRAGFTLPTRTQLPWGTNSRPNFKTSLCSHSQTTEIREAIRGSKRQASNSEISTSSKPKSFRVLAWSNSLPKQHLSGKFNFRARAHHSLPDETWSSKAKVHQTEPNGASRKSSHKVSRWTWVNKTYSRTPARKWSHRSSAQRSSSLAWTWKIRGWWTSRPRARELLTQFGSVARIISQLRFPSSIWYSYRSL